MRLARGSTIVEISGYICVLPFIILFSFINTPEMILIVK